MYDWRSEAYLAGCRVPYEHFAMTRDIILKRFVRRVEEVEKGRRRRRREKEEEEFPVDTCDDIEIVVKRGRGSNEGESSEDSSSSDDENKETSAESSTLDKLKRFVSTKKSAPFTFTLSLCRGKDGFPRVFHADFL